MQNINIVFDDIYDDVAIIAIPDNIVPDIERLGNEYLNWIPPEDDVDGWVFLNGRKVMCKEADGFVKWLNVKCCNGQAYVVNMNTVYCPEYPMIEF